MKEYTNRSRIEKTSDTVKKVSTRISCANPYAVSNVNQPQGPRTGNAAAHDAKRGEFSRAKEARYPLADQVMGMFSTRQSTLEKNPGESVARDGGSISGNNPPRKLPKSTTGSTRTRKK
jgi:hypothetical protein